MCSQSILRLHLCRLSQCFWTACVTVRKNMEIHWDSVINRYLWCLVKWEQEDTADRGIGSLEEMREKSGAVIHTWQQNLKAEWFGTQGEDLVIHAWGQDCWTLLWHPFSLFSLFVIKKKKKTLQNFRWSHGYGALIWLWPSSYEKNSILKGEGERSEVSEGKIKAWI